MEQPTQPSWTRKHLLALEDLSADEIRFVLDTADSFKEVSTRSIKKGSQAVSADSRTVACSEAGKAALLWTIPPAEARK